MYSGTAQYLLNTCMTVLCKGLDKYSYSRSTSVLAVKCVHIGVLHI